VVTVTVDEGSIQAPPPPRPHLFILLNSKIKKIAGVLSNSYLTLCSSELGLAKGLTYHNNKKILDTYQISDKPSVLLFDRICLLKNMIRVQVSLFWRV